MFAKKLATFSLFFLLCGSGVFSLCNAAVQEKSIVLMVTSYNNSQWYKRNLDSIFSQNYSNYKVIYTDDRSPDGTGDLVEKYIEEHGVAEKIVLIKNEQRKLKVENFYNGVHRYCEDDDIVIDFDGDDWLPHDDVLSIINEAYSDPNVWVTYGSYVAWPKPLPGGAQPLPKWVVKENAYRRYDWVTTHMKTFYAWLFKNIRVEDFKFDGCFMDSAGDLAIMLPILEMAGGKFKYITDVLYVYNRANPINDNKVRVDRQKLLSREIKRKPAYDRVDSLPFMEN